MFAQLEDFRYIRWVKRLNRTTQILLSVTLVAGLNYVAARHFQRWDLTPDKRYSLSAETRARLEQNVPRTKDTPLQLIFVVQQDQTSNDNRVLVDRVRTLLDEYKYAAENVEGGPVPLTVQEVDPERQATLAKQLEQYSSVGFTPENLPQLIVRRGDRARVLLKGDLYGVDIQNDASKIYAETKDFRGENAITSAILDVVETKADHVYFTTRHGEASVSDTFQRGLSRFGDALRQRNYRVDELDLSGPNLVPDDAQVVVIANPTTAFLPEEVEKLRRYLDEKNGRILLLLNPNYDTHQLTGLEGLMHDWGLMSPNLMVAEGDPNHLTADSLQMFSPVQDYKRTKHDITKSLAVNNQTVLLALPRPVEADPTASKDAQSQVHELLATSNNSYAVDTHMTGQIDPKKAAAKGPIVVAAISERRSTPAVDLPGGKLLVYGDTFMATNYLFGKLGNALLMVNSINYLANHNNLLNIRPQIPQEAQINISDQQLKGVGWRLAVLPGVMALFGLVVCWMRNRI